MPTWLAIAIPSVVAVAAVLMWALDYTKKAHEIRKLRLDLEKLKREERKERRKASGLYIPTAAEVDRFNEISRRSGGRGGAGGALHEALDEDDGVLRAPSFILLIVATLGIILLFYAVLRLLIDLVKLVQLF
jgi:hypothetical protein